MEVNENVLSRIAIEGEEGSLIYHNYDIYGKPLVKKISISTHGHCDIEWLDKLDNKFIGFMRHAVETKPHHVEFTLKGDFTEIDNIIYSHHRVYKLSTKELRRIDEVYVNINHTHTALYLYCNDKLFRHIDFDNVFINDNCDIDVSNCSITPTEFNYKYPNHVLISILKLVSTEINKKTDLYQHVDYSPRNILLNNGTELDNFIQIIKSFHHQLHDHRRVYVTVSYDDNNVQRLSSIIVPTEPSVSLPSLVFSDALLEMLTEYDLVDGVFHTGGHRTIGFKNLKTLLFSLDVLPIRSN